MAKSDYRLFYLPEGEKDKKKRRVNWRSWPVVLILGFAVGFVAIVDRGGVAPARADGSTACRLTVSADDVNVRTGPTLEAETVEVLRRDAEVDGTAEVTDGYRQLADGRWVADQFVTPVAGTDCS